MFNYNSDSAGSIAVKWSIIFFLLGTIYIFITDLLLYTQITDYALYSTFQTYKGIIFITIVSIAVFLAIRHLLSRIHKKQENLLYALEAGNMAAWDYEITDHEIGQSAKRYTLCEYETKDGEGNFSRFFQSIPETMREKIEAEIIKSLETGDPIDKELKLKTATGSESWHWLKGRVKYDSQEAPRRISGVLIDISNRKKTEQKLRWEEKFSKASINSVPGIFFVLDERGYLIRWNDHSNELSGLADKELINTHVIERVEEREIPKARRALDMVLMTGSIQTELALKTVGETESIFKITASKFRKNGEQFIVGTGININELIAKQKKIRRQNYQLQTAQDIAQLGYWENNLSQGTLNWTDTVYQLFGLDKKTFDLTVDNFLSLVHPEDRKVFELDIENLKQSGSFKAEYRLFKTDGTVGWFLERGEVFEWHDGEPKILHGIVMDITQQKKREQEIRNSLLEGENKERHRIANELHDGISQYLTASLLHLDGAESGLTNLKKDQADKLRNARKLVKNALDETQAISQNLMPKNIENQGLRAAVKSLIDQYKISADIRFALDFRKEAFRTPLSTQIEVNLYRIIQELLSNAVSHAQCDKVCIELSQHKEILSCIFSDNGCGRALPEIAQAESFGLRSIYNRVQLLSGSVQFNNKPGKGLEVTMNIPIK